MSADQDSVATILVVDDNPLIVNVIKSLMLAEHYRVCTAENGEAALEELNKHDVDVIICDVMMPKMDGYAFHDQVRQRGEFSHIPFLFLSALSDNVEVQRGQQSGADDYLTKPFDPKSMLAIVRGKVVRSRTLRQQNTEKYEAYRKRVVHTLSHEFRTPLVAINTGTELLIDHKENLAPDRVVQLLDAVRRGGQRLERLVTDFMILQQIEAGTSKKLFDNRSKIDTLQKVFARYWDINQIDFAKDGFTLQCNDRSEGAEIRVYEPHIADILGRLMSNAKKFSSSNKTLEVEMFCRGAEVVFQLSDRGIGIDLTRLKEAMTMFGQLDREKLEQQGSGVGLTISARLAKINGGGLEFEGREGGGAVVRLVLPKYVRPLVTDAPQESSVSK